MDEGEALTAREVDVLRCASHGLTEELTADTLGIVAGTVSHHRDTARLRLRAKNTTHACCIALRAGLIA
jgi:DNA-binding CsgD family transcriptional regulator